MNPVSFRALAEKCRKLSGETCVVVDDLRNVSLPLQRKRGTSYLIKAGVGAEKGTMKMVPSGPVSTLVSLDAIAGKPTVDVPIVRTDDIIQEDVYLLMIDVQGYEYFALQGASKLFERNVVRQLIFEVDAKFNGAVGVDFMKLLSLVYWEYGMTCFTVRNDFHINNNRANSYGMHADSADAF